MGRYRTPFRAQVARARALLARERAAQNGFAPVQDQPRNAAIGRRGLRAVGGSYGSR